MSATGRLQWRYGAAMEVTDDYVPIDSSYEGQIALALVAEKRTFTKPLRYDGVVATFPDFVLTDTVPPVPMEIYGFNGEQYQRRKVAKIAEYQSRKKPHWWWDTNLNTVPPSFPPPK